MNKRYLLLGTLVVLALTGCGYQPAPDKTQTTSPTPTYSAPTEGEVTALTDLARTNFVRLTTSKGVIDLELYPDDAPVHVANFLKLIQAGFYDGLTFHRVEPNFVIQGGDPLSRTLPAGDPSLGTGGPGYTIKAEFNQKKHETGTLAMARSADPNSAGSQFYLTLAPQPRLDDLYTVFGQAIAGLDVISKIAKGDQIEKIEILKKNNN